MIKSLYEHKSAMATKQLTDLKKLYTDGKISINNATKVFEDVILQNPIPYALSNFKLYLKSDDLVYLDNILCTIESKLMLHLMNTIPDKKAEIQADFMMDRLMGYYYERQSNNYGTI